jgi:hypothetical protein
MQRWTMRLFLERKLKEQGELRIRIEDASFARAFVVEEIHTDFLLGRWQNGPSDFSKHSVMLPYEGKVIELLSPTPVAAKTVKPKSAPRKKAKISNPLEEPDAKTDSSDRDAWLDGISNRNL